MQTIFLQYDGRCRWVEKRLLKGYLPKVLKSALDPRRKMIYMIEEWVSNKNGRMGADTKWLRRAGVPTFRTYRDVPQSTNFAILNTGYDSIVEQEHELRQRGIEIIDDPCPFVKKLRNIFENCNQTYQYILLCEPDHIIMKNYRTLFPSDMILIQINNYEEKIRSNAGNKGFRLVPYVTFLPSQVKRIESFIRSSYPERVCEVYDTYCIWVRSPTSPIVEIQNMPTEKLQGIQDALLISTANSRNTSQASLAVVLKERGLRVINISGLKKLREYNRNHPHEKVLLVRSPIPNKVEKKIMIYLRKGLAAVLFSLFADFLKDYAIILFINPYWGLRRIANLLYPPRSKA